jgi:hypothetical protein
MLPCSHTTSSAAAVLNQLFETLPEGEQEIIARLTRARIRSGFAATNNSFGKTMSGLARARITTERPPEKIQSFERWTAIRQAT